MTHYFCLFLPTIPIGLYAISRKGKCCVSNNFTLDNCSARLNGSKHLIGPLPLSSAHQIPPGIGVRYPDGEYPGQPPRPVKAKPDVVLRASDKHRRVSSHHTSQGQRRRLPHQVRHRGQRSSPLAGWCAWSKRLR